MHAPEEKQAKQSSEMTTGQITRRRRNGAIFLRRWIHYWRPDTGPAGLVGKWA